MTTLVHRSCAKPPSYAQVLAEKYGLSQLPSTSSEGFSDYQDSDRVEEEEEDDNVTLFEYSLATTENNNETTTHITETLNTNEAIFMQRCINLVHRSNKDILKSFFKRTKLLGWDEFSKHHCIITEIKQSCILRHVLKCKWKIGEYYTKEKNFCQVPSSSSQSDINANSSNHEPDIRSLQPNRSYVVPGTREAVPCPDCEGSGTYNCYCCEGETTIVCTKCVGGYILMTEEGEIRCFDCEGQGTIRCPNCLGKGFFKCGRCRQIGRVYQYKKIKVAIEKEMDTEYECFERVFPRSLLDSSFGDKYSRKIRPETLREIRLRENDERALIKAKKTLEIIPISRISCLTAEDRQISYVFWLVGRKPYLYHTDN